MADSTALIPENLAPNDRVQVDWSEGQGPVDEFTGTVTNIHVSGREAIISVEADEDTYPPGSIYGGTHDAAPEWVTPLQEAPDE